MVRVFLSISAVLVVATVIVAAPNERVSAQSSQPNVLVIVTDDQRAGTFAVMPAVRRWLVRGGTQYPNAFATTPLCCPSRGSLLTGLLAHNHGLLVTENGEAQMAAVESLMLQHPLQGAGYRTGLFGKYLNTWPVARDPAGWDRWATTPRVTFRGDEWNLDGQVQIVDRNSTSFIAGRTLDFLEEAERLDDDQPWFTYLGIMAPHSPSEVPPEYADEPVPALRSTPAMLERDFSDKPLWLRRRHAPRRDVGKLRARHLRTLIHIDDQVGRLMLRLEDLGELPNTIVVFTSDNGYMWGDHGLYGKQAPYDRSIRVPLLLRWPGRVGAGRTDSSIVGLLDLTPTILTAAGAPFPHAMDGTDLRGTFSRRWIPLEFWRVTPVVPAWRAAMSKRWVYIEYLDDAGRLRGREHYNLVRDPYQLTNVFRDGIRGNEPNVGRLHRLVLRLSRCDGAACLD